MGMWSIQQVLLWFVANIDPQYAGAYSIVTIVTKYLMDVRLLVSLIVILSAKPYFLGNTIKTNEEFHAEHELGYRDMIKSLTKRNNQLQKKVHDLS